MEGLCVGACDGQLEHDVVSADLGLGRVLCRCLGDLRCRLGGNGYLSNLRDLRLGNSGSLGRSFRCCCRRNGGGLLGQVGDTDSRWNLGNLCDGSRLRLCRHLLDDGDRGLGNLCGNLGSGRFLGQIGNSGSDRDLRDLRCRGCLGGRGLPYVHETVGDSIIAVLVDRLACDDLGLGIIDALVLGPLPLEHKGHVLIGLGGGGLGGLEALHLVVVDRPVHGRVLRRSAEVRVLGLLPDVDGRAVPVLPLIACSEPAGRRRRYAGRALRAEVPGLELLVLVLDGEPDAPPQSLKLAGYLRKNSADAVR